jgi:hypothetical protein
MHIQIGKPKNNGNLLRKGKEIVFRGAAVKNMVSGPINRQRYGTVPCPRDRASTRHGWWLAVPPSAQRRTSDESGTV